MLRPGEGRAECVRGVGAEVLSESLAAGASLEPLGSRQARRRQRTLRADPSPVNVRAACQH